MGAAHPRAVHMVEDHESFLRDMASEPQLTIDRFAFTLVLMVDGKTASVTSWTGGEPSLEGGQWLDQLLERQKSLWSDDEGLNLFHDRLSCQLYVCFESKQRKHFRLFESTVVESGYEYIIFGQEIYITI